MGETLNTVGCGIGLVAACAGVIATGAALYEGAANYGCYAIVAFDKVPYLVGQIMPGHNIVPNPRFSDCDYLYNDKNWREPQPKQHRPVVASQIKLSVLRDVNGKHIFQPFDPLDKI